MQLSTVLIRDCQYENANSDVSVSQVFPCSVLTDAETDFAVVIDLISQIRLHF